MCSACTVRDGKERVFTLAYIELGEGAPINLANLPPLQLGVNTIEPTGGGQ